MAMRRVMAMAGFPSPRPCPRRQLARIRSTKAAYRARWEAVKVQDIWRLKAKRWDTCATRAKGRWGWAWETIFPATTERFR